LTPSPPARCASPPLFDISRSDARLPAVLADGYAILHADAFASPVAFITSRHGARFSTAMFLLPDAAAVYARRAMLPLLAAAPEHVMICGACAFYAMPSLLPLCACLSLWRAPSYGVERHAAAPPFAPPPC